MNQIIASRPARRSLTIRIASIVVLAGMSAGLAACDQSEQNFEQSIVEARDAVLVLTAGGSWPAPDEQRGPALQKIISDLNQAMSTVEGDAKAPAQLLIARATAGMADIEMSEASSAASSISLDLTRANALAREYSSNLAIVTTRVGPDAGEASQTIEENIREIDAEIRRLEADRQDLNRQLETVRNEIEQLQASARGERLEEGELRAQSLEAEPMRRAELISQAVARSRAAESYELTADERALTVDSIEIAIAQVDRFIENQRALRSIQTRGLERISSIDEGISSRRQNQIRSAQDKLDAYSAALSATIEQYESEFVDTLESAISGYASAASLASQARAMGQLASSASGEHSAAAARAHELHSQIARQIASSASYITQLSGASAADKQRYAAIADRFTQIADQAMASAADSYSEAASGFGGAGASGQTISERYQNLAAQLRGEEPEPVGEESGDGMGEEWGQDQGGDPMTDPSQGDAPADDAGSEPNG